MTRFEGNLQDFHDFIGPRIRNDIATITKKKKIELNYICQKCNQKKELHAAHKHSGPRRSIIEQQLVKYKTENGEYNIPDLRKTIRDIIEAHKPVEDYFFFYCELCHKEYDDAGNSVGIRKRSIGEEKIEYINTTNVVLSETVKLDYEKEFIRLLSTSKSLKQCLKELFAKFPNQPIKSTNLRKIWEMNFPEGNSQKVTDYLWNLEKEGILENTSRSIYRLAIQNRSVALEQLNSS